MSKIEAMLVEAERDVVSALARVLLVARASARVPFVEAEIEKLEASLPDLRAAIPAAEARLAKLDTSMRDVKAERARMAEPNGWQRRDFELNDHLAVKLHRATEAYHTYRQVPRAAGRTLADRLAAIERLRSELAALEAVAVGDEASATLAILGVQS